MNHETVVKAGDAWGSLTLGWKWSIAVLALSVVGTAAGGGFWVGIQVTKVEYQAAINRLERQLAAREPSPLSGLKVETFDVYPFAKLPNLADAIEDKHTLIEYAEDRERHNEKFKGRTAIQTPDFASLSVGRRFTWSGMVAEVSGSGDRYAITIWTHHDLNAEQPKAFTMRCNFDGRSHDTALRTLTRDDTVMVEGVLGENGELYACNLLKVAPPAKVSFSMWEGE